MCSFHGVKWDPVPGHLPVSLPPASSSAGSQEWGHSPASRGCCSQAVPSSCHPFSFDPVYLLPPNSSCLQPRFFCWGFLLAALGDFCIWPLSHGECQQIHATWSWFSGHIFCSESSLFLAFKYTVCETFKVQDLLLGIGLMIFCLNSFSPQGSSLQMKFKWTHGKQNYSASRTDTNLS